LIQFFAQSDGGHLRLMKKGTYVFLNGEGILIQQAL